MKKQKYVTRFELLFLGLVAFFIGGLWYFSTFETVFKFGFGIGAAFMGLIVVGIIKLVDLPT